MELLIAVAFNYKHFKVVVGDLNDTDTFMYFLLVLQFCSDACFE